MCEIGGIYKLFLRQSGALEYTPVYFTQQTATLDLEQQLGVGGYLVQMDLSFAFNPAKYPGQLDYLLSLRNVSVKIEGENGQRIIGDGVEFFDINTTQNKGIDDNIICQINGQFLAII